MNIGAYEGAGEAGCVYRDNGYVKEVGGVDTADTTHGDIGAPWRTITFGIKYAPILNVRSGFYTTGETFPINVYHGQDVTGESNLTVTIESNTAASVFELANNGAIDNCGVRNKTATTGLALIKIVKYRGDVRRNQLYWVGTPPSPSYGIWYDVNATAGTVYKNTIYNQNRGIYLAITPASTAYVTADGNTVVKYTNSGIYVDKPTPAYYNVMNNIVSQAGQLNTASVITTYGIYRTSTNVTTCTYNDLWGNDLDYFGGAAAGTGTINSYPRFVDPYNNDYRIYQATSYSSSPCLGAGSGGASTNIGAYEGTGLTNVPCRDLGYVKESGGVDVADSTHGDINGTPWRTITFGEKYAMKLIVKSGYYSTGETFPINIYHGQYILGEDPATSVIEAPSSYAGNVFELGNIGTLEACFVRNLSTTTGKALARVIKGYGEIRRNLFSWGGVNRPKSNGI